MYELMIVASADRADQLLGRVEKSLKELGATAIKVDRLGKKQLAYPIKKHADGVYFLVDFEILADGIKPISDKLRLEQEDLLRYLLLKKEKVSGKKGAKVGFVEAGRVEEKEETPATKPKVTVVTKTKFLAKVEKKKVTKVSKVAKGTKVSTAEGESRSRERKVSKAKKGKK